MVRCCLTYYFKFGLSCLGLLIFLLHKKLFGIWNLLDLSVPSKGYSVMRHPLSVIFLRLRLLEYTGVQHIMFCSVFPRFMYPMLPISLDCLCYIAPSTLFNAYWTERLIIRQSLQSIRLFGYCYCYCKSKLYSLVRHKFSI